MVNKLILGTVQLGIDYGINNQKGKPSLEDSFKILHTAYDKGIRILDSAEAYGNAQEVIGHFHRETNKHFKIITKLAANQDFSNLNLSEKIRLNCRSLGIASLDTYMFHNYKSFKENKHLYESFIEAKEERLIEKIGISLHSNQEIMDILENYPVFSVIQLPFNVLDNHTKRSDVLQKAQEKGVEIHTRSAFLQGLLFMNVAQLPLKLKPLKPYLEVVQKIREEQQITMAEMALQYAMSKEYIDQVLIGVDSLAQLEANLRIVDQPYKKEVIAQLDEINVSEEALLNPANWN